MKTFSNLNAAVDHAIIDEDLFSLLLDQKSNIVLQQFLLNKYFLLSNSNLINPFDEQKELFDEIESKILHESPVDYRAEIKSLLQQQNEEEVFLRGSLFKREIPKIYNNTCCISGMRIDATINVSMVDACHIVPFSFSYDDTISNGIALCPNLHRAFDRGLIAIDSKYKVVVSNVFKEIETSYAIKSFEGQEISLPKQFDFKPRKENFEWHFDTKFLK